MSLQERSQVKAECGTGLLSDTEGAQKGAQIEIISVFLSTAPQSVPHTHRERKALRQMQRWSGNSNFLTQQGRKKKKER